MKFKKPDYSAKADYSLDKIGREVSGVIRKNLRDEMSDEILENPQITTVDYRSEKPTYEKESTEKNAYSLYNHITNDGNISAKKTTPERESQVKEIFKDGTSQISSREEFEEKLNASNPDEKDMSELKTIVRITSKTPEDYANSEKRFENAFESFESNKYLIEETAARAGIPPSLLASLYYKFMADDGSLNAAKPNERYVRMGYARLYGNPLECDSSVLNDYMSTTEGLLDVIAMGLKSESKFFQYDIYNLSTKEMHELLTNYGKWHNYPQYFDDSVVAYNDVFESIYKKLPGMDYEVTVI